MSKLATTLEGFRDQPDEELQQALAKTRDDLFRLQLGQHTNQVTSTAELMTKRRDIARIMTILRARKLGLESQAQKTESTASASLIDTPPAKKTKKAK
ncbi:MAG: 50S ribosomal protein L29 [Deltaproteobacteria bacterium]|nr:50S ribosomal protein L29 [Deltaproteobacteria bacterium]MCW5805820.1 50S ribosomal protein L29 [Deltaproteobacteria bacterium]